MSESPSQPEIDPPCGVILYRAIRRSSWIDQDNDSRMMAEAFGRRRPKVDDEGQVIDSGDDDGLSVFDMSRIDQRACIEDNRSCYGLTTLHVGTLRDLGLHVIRDPKDDRKILIVNMPLENPNDADQEALLEAVADSARINIRCKHKRK